VRVAALWVEQRDGVETAIRYKCPFCARIHAHGAGEAGGEGLSASRVEHRLSHCAYGERCGDVEVVISEHATPRVANEMATFGKFEGK
jgi:hypothetical protein